MLSQQIRVLGLKPNRIWNQTNTLQSIHTHSEREAEEPVIYP